MFADLHLHTIFSDGTYTPEELAGHGARLKFRALALRRQFFRRVSAVGKIRVEMEVGEHGLSAERGVQNAE